MRFGCHWTPEEEAYLEDRWGSVSIPAIAKKLERTPVAVRERANRMGLGSSLSAGGYVTFNQLMLAITGGAQSHSLKMRSWVENRGMPVHKKRVDKCSWRVVYLDEFWKWAEQNRSFIDFSKLEPLAFGKEPAWVAEQRRKDFQARLQQKSGVWTREEDDRLISLLKQQRYGYAELSRMLCRSAGAISTRCRCLGIKDRPVRADNHGKSSAWAEQDIKALADGIRCGDSYTAIAHAVGRSEKAVRGKVYFDYLTEDADKVRAMLGDGSWGHGAPEVTVRQGFNLSRTRTAVRKNLSLLDALLRKRIDDQTKEAGE